MEPRPLVLAVDRNHKNLEVLSRVLNERGYQNLTATSFEELDEALEDDQQISLALIDLAGFDEGIWLRCDALRQAGIPFLIISPRNLPSVQATGTRHGATGVLVKPLAAEELFGLINSLLGR